jgi:hypothetical protein
VLMGLALLAFVLIEWPGKEGDARA